MSRIAKNSDFIVAVEGVGNFTFGRRVMRDEIEIQREYAGMIDGVKPTEWLEVVCGWISALRVLTVRAPSGWDVDEMDPLDNATYLKIQRVHEALSTKELSFRSGNAAVGEGTSSTEV